VRLTIFAVSVLLLLCGDRGAAAGERGGAACARAAHAAVALHGTIDMLGFLRGPFTELSDLRSGQFVRRFDVAGLGETMGSDGTTAWISDWSGTVHRYDAVHARAVAATDAWFDRRGWCAPNRLVGRLTAPALRSQGGRAFAVVQAVPRGGVPVEIWFDRRSGLPDRTILRLNEDTRVVRFSDWRDVDGAVIPFVRRIEYPEDGDVVTLTTRAIALRPVVHDVEFAPPPQRDDVRMVRGARSTTVPIRIEAHKILVDVKLDGRGPFPFVLDTGGHFILTATTARRLGLSVLAANPARAPWTSSGFVRVRELRIGEAVVREGVAHMIPYPFVRVERGPLPPKAGWLGLELFERFSAIVDPVRRTLTLTPLRGRHARYPGVRVPLTLDEDAPLVPCRVGGMAGECMVDTGNAGSTIVEAHWAHAVGLDRRFSRGLDAGAGVRVARAAINVGALRLPHEIVAAYPQARNGSESTTVEAAILSETLHERYVTSIDYRQGAMWLAPARHRADPVFNRTGLQLRRRADGAFDVTFVYAGSPAAAAGLRAGDRIVAIGGKPAPAMTPDELTAVNTAPVGTVRTYRVVSAGSNAARTVRVRLAELLP